MNGWFLVIWTALMLSFGAAQIAITITGWKPSGYAASSHDDPSPGPNSLF